LAKQGEDTVRNHHRVGSGSIGERAVDWDGYIGVMPKSSAMVAEVLRHHGYKTAAFGKWHNTPATETTAMGPFDRWPTGYPARSRTCGSRSNDGEGEAREGSDGQDGDRRLCAASSRWHGGGAGDPAEHPGVRPPPGALRCAGAELATSRG
jgi:arylsulfatase A-like enzyme